jgi:plasmid stabilization system protein ParE
VTYRLAERAEDAIDAILLESARRWGVPASAKYNRLILAALTAIGDTPALPGSRDIPRVAGLRTYHLRFARNLVDSEHRVARPRHLVIYQVGSDGVVEILSLAHDRQQLARVARRAQREANG